MAKSDDTSAEKRDREGLTGPSAVAIKKMEADGRKVMLVGRIKNGKLEIDQNRLRDLEERFPNANMSFVAVNAHVRSRADLTQPQESGCRQ